MLVREIESYLHFELALSSVRLPFMEDTLIVALDACIRRDQRPRRAWVCFVHVQRALPATTDSLTTTSTPTCGASLVITVTLLSG